MTAAWPIGALALLQGMQPLPATAPIGGWLWAYVVPGLLLAVAFLATWALYRRFAGKEDQGRR
jgi:TRAP-type C4-dicarboxylate transport system permease large subunit